SRGLTGCRHHGDGGKVAEVQVGRQLRGPCDPGLPPGLVVTIHEILQEPVQIREGGFLPTAETAGRWNGAIDIDLIHYPSGVARVDAAARVAPVVGGFDLVRLE